MKPKIFFLLLAVALALASCTKRKPEEVDYAPDSPFNPYPPDSATNIDHTTLDVTLRWTATDPNSGDVLTYALYFDTLNPPVTQVATGLTASSYFMTGLKYRTTYYWKLYITDAAGVITSGPVWQFTTLPHANSAPSVPMYLDPVNDSIGTYPTLGLAWAGGADPNGSSDTVTFSLYLGKTSPLPLATITRGFSYKACCLNYSTLYGWQVVATDNHGAVTAAPLARFTTRESPWFHRAPMPLARKHFATAMANNKIYVIGGQDESNTATGTVQEYDPALNVWSIKTSMPTPRYELAAASVSERIYAIGGKNTTDSILGATEEYDPVTDSWTVKRSMVVPRWSLIAQPVNGLIYAIGGIFKAPTVINMVVEIYTPATNKWVKLRIITRPPTTPQARLNTMSGVINGRIYIAGGFDPWRDSFSGNLNIFNTATNSFSRESPLPEVRSNGLGVVANGCFYVIGGYDGNFLRRVEKYDPMTGEWAQRGDMLNSRSGCGGGVYNNNIFVIGGFNPDPVMVTEEYQTGLDP